MKKQDDNLNFEEAVFGTFSDDPAYIELPLHRQIFFVMAGVATVLVLAALFRLLSLNVLKGDFYKMRASANVNREVVLSAKRGIIFDSYGAPLVGNDPVFSIFLDTREFLRKDSSSQQKLVDDLRAIFSENNVEDIDAEKVIAEADLERNPSIALLRGVSTELAIALKGLNDASVKIEDDYRRSYPYGPSLAHVLGYTGLRDFERTIEGKSGLESFYDINLRGLDGKFVEGKDVSGNSLHQRVAEEPQSGDNLYTTIDAELQNYFYDRMLSGLNALGRHAGVGIILNPQNGDVLALINFPSFDNNIFTLPNKGAERSALLRSPQKPLFNRAISGVYNPGSTIKPFIALSALREKIIDPIFSVFSAGVLELANPYNPDQPSKFLDWKAHGWVNLYSALARSSNIYFYEVGGGYGNFKGLGIKKIQEYFKYFGFEDKTGVDIDSEAVGELLGPEYREKHGRIWRVGDTYNVSIGQGDLSVVPLRLINFIGSIGVGGKIFQPHFIKEIRDAEGILVENFLPKVTLDYSDFGSDITEVQKGLRATVSTPDGTAYLLNDLPMSVSGKTGSAQIQNNTKVNAFFVGYAPSENPELAILVMVEDAKEGSLNTIPIVKDVLRWYYDNRISTNK